MMPIYDEYTDFIEKLADASGRVVKKYFRQPLAVDNKSDTSPVTKADREAEAVIRKKIETTYPKHGIIGEEGGSHQPDAEFVWVIDPIDGTKSFITGKPFFTTLIALLHKGKPVLGVIDQPILKERWLGVKGQKTTFNGTPCKASGCKQLAAATLSTTSPDLFSAVKKKRFDRVKNACRYTVYGGDAYAYGLLASGFIDMVMESELKPHDFLALIPVLEGAGATLTDWQGKPLTRHSGGDALAAATSSLHTQALKI